jgi:hypothetical protein
VSKAPHQSAPCWPPVSTARAHSRAGKAISPSRLLLISLLVFFAGLTVAPVVSTFAVSTGGIIYWGIFVLAAYSGLRLGMFRLGPVRRAHRIAPSSLLRAARRTVALGLVGVVLLIYVRFVLRSAPFELDFLAVRDALESSTPGAMGFVAALLAAFSPFGYITTALARAHGAPVSRRLWLASLAAPIVYVAVSLSQGSRSVLLVVVLLHVVSGLYLRRLAGRRVDRHAALAAVVVFVVVAFASAALMLERLDQMGVDPMVSIEASGYAVTLQPSPEALAWIASRGDSTALSAAAFSLCQYVFHGFFEFNLLFTRFADQHTLGALTFWLPAKVASMASGLELNVDTAGLIGWRDGIYTTFAGPAFVDFGLFAPLAMLLLFWLLGIPARRLCDGDTLLLPLVCIVGCIALLFPVVSLLDSSSGAYPLVAALGIKLLGTDLRRRRVPASTVQAARDMPVVPALNPPQ